MNLTIHDAPEHLRSELLERITVDPQVMSGHPCVRGMRVTVSNVLRLLAARHGKERILKAYPYLEPLDIDACLAYAADHQEELTQGALMVIDANRATIRGLPIR